jgi:hypothetical protein
LGRKRGAAKGGRPIKKVREGKTGTRMRSWSMRRRCETVARK